MPDGKFAAWLFGGVLVILFGSGLLVKWAFDKDSRDAQEYCNSLSATEKVYAGDGHYLCLDGEGRILGRR